MGPLDLSLYAKLSLMHNKLNNKPLFLAKKSLIYNISNV